VKLETLLAFTAALLCSGLGIGVLYRRPHTLVPWAFALGMLVLALRETLVGLGAQATLPLAALHWQQLGWMVTALLPGSWLLFSLSFGRSNIRAFLTRWKWVVAGALALPLLVVAVVRQAFFQSLAETDGIIAPVLPLSRAGSALCIFNLVMAVVILVNLEASLRASTGRKRWQIKFMILGIGSIFAVYVYTMNQAMLFATVTPIMQTVDSFAVVLADILIGISLARHRLGTTQVSLSPTTLAHSLTVLLVGVYLLVVGVLAKFISVWGSHQLLPLGAFFVFVALLGLAVVLLSDQRRHRFKHFISRHVYQARHDYRQAWTTFNERTISVVDVRELCTVVTKIVSETFVVPEVTIWLWQDEGARHVRPGGSTVFSAEQAHPPGFSEPGMAELVAYLQEHQCPVDLATAPDVRGQELWQSLTEGVQRVATRYVVPLRAGREFLGMITLSEHWRREPLPLEDLNFLKIIADQTATSLHNLQLVQRLARAQQLAALQTLSVFFVHDLKNLASNLGMTLQNLPVHYDNPEFREDLLRLIADSVAKIDGMRGRLSSLTQQLEIHCTETDLNALVQSTLAGLRPSLSVPLITECQPLPRLQIDPEQIEKVLVNLVLNAHEAVGASGEIRVMTERLNGYAVLAVHDNGCGMAREFIEQTLFQPFQTTKRQGLGIGLFQSKMIIEAHQGSIEAESEQGKGSTFRVLLRC
jgi:putative PEP-CTERM system histidine kinase